MIKRAWPLVLENLANHAQTLLYAVLSGLANISIQYVWQQSSLMSHTRSRLEELSLRNRFLSYWLSFLFCGYCLGTWSYLLVWCCFWGLPAQELATRPHLLGFLAGLGFFYLGWRYMLSSRNLST